MRVKRANIEIKANDENDPIIWLCAKLPESSTDEYDQNTIDSSMRAERKMAKDLKKCPFMRGGG